MSIDIILSDIVDNLTIRKNILLYNLFDGIQVEPSQLTGKDKKLYEAYEKAIENLNIIIAEEQN